MKKYLEGWVLTKIYINAWVRYTQALPAFSTATVTLSYERMKLHESESDGL